MENPPQMPMPGAPLGAVPPQPAPTPAAEYGPAGFWIRAGALMMDKIIVAIGLGLIVGVLILLGIPRLPAFLLGYLFPIAYFSWLPSANSGQTVGKMAAGIAIVRMDGSPLTFLRCLGRWTGSAISYAVVYIGFVMAAFTDQKRALHDYMADTRVVYVQQIETWRKALVILLGICLPLFVFLAIAAAIAIPRFTDMSKRATEGMSKANLGSIRSALAIYYGDLEGQYPADLSALTVGGKYLQQIPASKTATHPDSTEVERYDASVCPAKELDLTKVRDTGRWGYVADPKASCYGTVFVDCTHTDAKQKQWAAY